MISAHTEAQIIVPAVVLADEALIELVHHSAQHGAGIVGKVQISDLHHRNRDDGERLLILFSGTRSQLQEESRYYTPTDFFTRTVNMSDTSRTHHQSDRPLLVDVDGDVGALDPGVGAQMSQPDVRVSARQTCRFLFSDICVTLKHNLKKY